MAKYKQNTRESQVSRSSQEANDLQVYSHLQLFAGKVKADKQTHTNEYEYVYKCKQTDKQTNKQTDKQTGKETKRTNPKTNRCYRMWLRMPFGLW